MSKVSPLFNKEYNMSNYEDGKFKLQLVALFCVLLYFVLIGGSILYTLFNAAYDTIINPKAVSHIEVYQRAVSNPGYITPTEKRDLNRIIQGKWWHRPCDGFKWTTKETMVNGKVQRVIVCKDVSLQPRKAF